MWKTSYQKLSDLCLAIRHNYLQCQTISFLRCEAEAVPFVQKILVCGRFSQKRQKMRSECTAVPLSHSAFSFVGREYTGWTHPWLPSTSVPSSMQLSGDFRVPWTVHQSHLAASCLLWARQRAPETAQEGVAWARWHFSLFYKGFVHKMCVVVTTWRLVCVHVDAYCHPGHE